MLTKTCYSEPDFERLSFLSAIYAKLVAAAAKNVNFCCALTKTLNSEPDFEQINSCSAIHANHVAPADILMIVGRCPSEA